MTDFYDAHQQYLALRTQVLRDLLRSRPDLAELWQRGDKDIVLRHLLAIEQARSLDPLSDV